MTTTIDAKRTRPSMKDYGISKDKKGMLEWEWVDQQATNSRNYWIASTRPDGNPHAAPVWGVWMDGALYFGTAPSSRKARNLNHNPEVVMHLESGDDVVIMEGRIEQRRADDSAHRPALERMAALYGEKYAGFTPELKADELYYYFKPRVVMAWTEKDFPKTATRWELV